MNPAPEPTSGTPCLARRGFPAACALATGVMLAVSLAAFSGAAARADDATSQAPRKADEARAAATDSTAPRAAEKKADAAKSDDRKPDEANAKGDKAEKADKTEKKSAKRCDDRIWTALVLATEADKPAPPPAELAGVAGKIERFFGYNQLEVIGSATKTIDEDFERWLVPSQNFWLCAKARHNAGDTAYMLDLSLYQDKRLLVQTQAKLGPNSPLLIRGPMHARGQLIIVLQVAK